jgi:hypothetical protein
MDESGVVWQLMFCFPKRKVLLRKVVFKRSGGFRSILKKLPAPFGEDALCKIQNIFQNNPA